MPKTASDERKQVWKFQEGAVVLALREAVCPPGHIHWHHTPKGMSIDPDVVIGKTPDLPDTIVFVTHASAEMAGQKKFWRTMAEVIEAKRLKSHPLILSVLYPGNVKEALKEVYTRAFEACLHLEDTSYGSQLDAFLDTLTAAHGTESEDNCLKHLEKQITSGACPHWKDFVADLKHALQEKHGSKHLLMCSDAFSHGEHLPKARTTSLRRSICKLSTLPEEARAALLAGKPVSTVPHHALLLGWFQEGLEGFEIVDNELFEFCKSTNKGVPDLLCKQIQNTLPAFVIYSHTIQQIASARIINRWIIKHYNELQTKAGMSNALSLVFADCKKPLMDVSPEVVQVEHHWLFQSIMGVLRTETGRSDGYGYSVLGKETGHEYEINAFAGTVIAPYLQLKKPLPNNLLDAVASVFAGHLKRLGFDNLKRLLEAGIAVQCESIFNFQMMNYRFFNPIDWLVCDRLKVENIVFASPATHESFLNVSEGEIASSTRSLICVRGQKVWIKCQSAYDGKIDKRKELCGRVGAMKLCYTSEELRKVRFYLVLDGFFEDLDLKLLSEAGWDGIFYYDELDALVSLVKKHA
jgi:hypothetical protein